MNAEKLKKLETSVRLGGKVSLNFSMQLHMNVVLLCDFSQCMKRINSFYY